MFGLFAIFFCSFVYLFNSKKLNCNISMFIPELYFSFRNIEFNGTNVTRDEFWNLSVEFWVETRGLRLLLIVAADADLTWLSLSLVDLVDFRSTTGLKRRVSWVEWGDLRLRCCFGGDFSVGSFCWSLLAAGMKSFFFVDFFEAHKALALWWSSCIDACICCCGCCCSTRILLELLSNFFILQKKFKKIEWFDLGIKYRKRSM